MSTEDKIDKAFIMLKRPTSQINRDFLWRLIRTQKLENESLRKQLKRESELREECLQGWNEAENKLSEGLNE